MLKIVESLKPFSSKINFPIVRAFRRINATSRWRVLDNKGSWIRWNVFVNGVSSSIILRNSSCSNREEYLSSNRAITAHIRGMKLRVDHRGKRSNVASRPSGCRRRHYFIIHSHGADKESQGRYMYRGGYKVTRCRELKPPRFSSGFLPVEKNNRNEVGWRANIGRKEEQEKKEKREREGESKKRSTKEEIKEKGNIGKSERKRKKEEQEWHVKKVVPLLFSPFHAPTAAL